VALAIASSQKKIPLPTDLTAFGEIGLTGEIRSVSQIEKRKKESQKMGFERIASGQKFRSLTAAIKEFLPK